MNKLTDPYNGVNAFHPDFMSMYYPNMWDEHEIMSRYSRDRKLTAYVDKRRETKPNHGTIFELSANAVSHKPLEYMKR